MNQESLSTKRQLLEHLLDQGMVLIALDGRGIGVDIPRHLAADPQLRLNLSYRFGLPMSVDDWGVRATLTFSGVQHECRIPWPSIFLMVSHVTGQPYLFPEDVPPELLAQATAAAMTDPPDPDADTGVRRLPQFVTSSPARPKRPKLTLIQGEGAGEPGATPESGESHESDESGDAGPQEAQPDSSGAASASTPSPAPSSVQTQPILRPARLLEVAPEPTASGGEVTAEASEVATDVALESHADLSTADRDGDGRSSATADPQTREAHTAQGVVANVPESAADSDRAAGRAASDGVGGEDGCEAVSDERMHDKYELDTVLKGGSTAGDVSHNDVSQSDVSGAAVSPSTKRDSNSVGRRIVITPAKTPGTVSPITPATVPATATPASVSNKLPMSVPVQPARYVRDEPMAEVPPPSYPPSPRNPPRRGHLRLVK